ncbi:site-specific integrase [Oscillatoria sp. CS-180]|uniref:tyrosine-type recombinase/integrase n=1 Tax=Oscillatoria sp. CS-180 TaxID=3021720 RepID=UPI00232EF328|nr:site-specific integrase [Oscillatoria sp. CS-180]MDB9526971.1 site-specific integrase [Oscillatoria sp. CS-180]
MLVYSGCRISEALELTPRRVELGEQCLRFRSLKKRKDKDGQPRAIYRTVPVPPTLLEQLDLVFGIREIQQRGDKRLDLPLWPRTRAWGWLVVKEVMEAAGISNGPHKTAKGLRHAFGIKAMQAGIQLNMLQKWMGHADLKTTAIYADAIGEEERDIASRMWG